VSEDWKFLPLGEVCDTGAGGTPLSTEKSYYEGGTIPWLQSGEVAQGEITYSKNFITEIGLDNSSAKIFPENTVLVAMYGATAGQVGILRIKAATNQAVCGILPNERLLPKFIYYTMLSKQDELISKAAGNAQPNISQIKVKTTIIPVPPLPEQKRIVAILDEAFAGIAAATANAEKNLANARELFTSCLNSTFRNVPRGWTTTTLGAVCNFHGGSQPPKSVFERDSRDDLIRLIQIRDYKSDNHIVYIPKDQARRFCDASDVMIGRYGPPLFQILRGIEGAYNVALMKAVPDKKRITKDFLFYFLKNGDILKYIIDASSRAAGQIGLNKETLEPYPISFPSIEAQGHLVSRLANLESDTRRLVAIYEQKLLRLAELKQAILRQAFSGELTALPGAKMQEEAA